MVDTIEKSAEIAAAKEEGHAEFLEWMARSYTAHPRQTPSGTLDEALARLDALYDRHGLKDWSETLGWQDAVHDWGGLPV